MGNRADGTVGVVIQIVVMVNNGVELRDEEQQKHKCSHILENGRPN